MARYPKRLHLLVAAAAGLGAVVVVARVTNGHSASADVIEAVAAKPARTDAASSGVASGPASTASASASASQPRLGERQRSIPASEGNAFATLSWLPPPPAPQPVKPAPPPPPAAPTVPPLPFTFVGMVEQGAGKPRAFLAKGDTLLVVSSGDVIENNNYRVDSLSPTSVVMTYLPMGKQQTISVSGSTQ